MIIIMACLTINNPLNNNNDKQRIRQNVGNFIQFLPHNINQLWQTYTCIATIAQSAMRHIQISVYSAKHGTTKEPQTQRMSDSSATFYGLCGLFVACCNICCFTVQFVQGDIFWSGGSVPLNVKSKIYNITWYW